jgi:hypothetical protein
MKKTIISSIAIILVVAILISSLPLTAIAAYSNSEYFPKYTGKSSSLVDALKAVGIPTVEVHISKVEEREDFRQISFVRLACVKTITGHGTNGYIEAIDYLTEGK